MINRMDLVKKLQSSYKVDLLSLGLIHSVLEHKSEDAKKALLKRACKNGDLIRIRNGLYLVGETRRRSHYQLLQIANLVQEPSYVSLESALSFYGLIPEAVYTTTSVTTKKNLEQKTPIGHFSFAYLKIDYFNFGFYQNKDGDQSFLIATPLKALMDYIVINKKHYKTLEDVEADLRFDAEAFFAYEKFVNLQKVNEMLKIYKSHRLQVILKNIRTKL